MATRRAWFFTSKTETGKQQTRTQLVTRWGVKKKDCCHQMMFNCHFKLGQCCWSCYSIGLDRSCTHKIIIEKSRINTQRQCDWKRKYEQRNKQFSIKKTGRALVVCFFRDSVKGELTFTSPVTKSVKFLTPQIISPAFGNWGLDISREVN